MTYNTNVNCIHFDEGACNKKPKVFFGFFRQRCITIGYHKLCPTIQPRPRPKITPQGQHKNICDICGRITNKDW